MGEMAEGAGRLVGPPRRAAARARLAVVAAFASAAWAAALAATPYVAGRRVGGRPGAVAAAAVYAVGGLVCHQRADRSFHPWGVRMPVCARCFGLYAAAPLGVVSASVVAGRRLGGGRRRLTPRRTRWLLVAAALPTAGAWLVEGLGLAAPSSVVRAALAVPLGAATGWVLARAIAEQIE